MTTTATTYLTAVAARERHKGRLYVHARALLVAHRLGLDLRDFARPAGLPPVNAGLTRCPGCGANVTPDHRPGSVECGETRRERDHQLGT